MEELEYDDKPAFHCMGFDDEEDISLLELKNSYMRRVRMDEAREKMGGSEGVHGIHLDKGKDS